MSNLRRREALGRNRGGPATRNLVPAAVGGCVLLFVVGLIAFNYFTAPARVLGSKLLDCPPYEITLETMKWAPYPVRVSGCDETVDVVCSESSCEPYSEGGF